jgi:hypothetical protein
MAAFDNDKQRMTGLANLRKETGSGVTIIGTGQAFTIATKLRTVRSGTGIMDTDGMVAVATTGLITNGQVTFTRLAPIATPGDTLTYDLYGF